MGAIVQCSPNLPVVVAVSRSARHTVRKAPQRAIMLRAGLGVCGDAHAGATVRHRFDRRREPGRANERQVHVIGAELLEELANAGLTVVPGELGENVMTRGIDLTALPVLTRLRIGACAVVELRGLRAPCVLIERLQAGLRTAVTMSREGVPALRHGVMGIVVAGGEVRPGDAVTVELPDGPQRALPLV
jgi:MOSC domain-containing protein YiiM